MEYWFNLRIDFVYNRYSVCSRTKCPFVQNMTFSVHENELAIVYNLTIHHSSKLQGEWIQAVGATISRIVCVDTR